MASERRKKTLSALNRQQVEPPTDEYAVADCFRQSPWQAADVRQAVLVFLVKLGFQDFLYPSSIAPDATGQHCSGCVGRRAPARSARAPEQCDRLADSRTIFRFRESIRQLPAEVQANFEIYVINAEGTDLKCLTDKPAADKSPLGQPKSR